MFSPLSGTLIQKIENSEFKFSLSTWLQADFNSLFHKIIFLPSGKEKNLSTNAEKDTVLLSVSSESCILIPKLFKRVKIWI